MLAGAEVVATAETTGENAIQGFTRHGINQVINRGITPQEILEAVNSPVEVNGPIVDQLGRISTQYIGPRATVVLNPNGIVVTAW